MERTMHIRPISPNTRHVMPAMNGGWVVRNHGAKRATKRFDTKGEAVSWGRSLSKRQGGELVIHREDGTVQRHDSYSRH